jgi:hypothetical protein
MEGGLNFLLIILWMKNIIKEPVKENIDHTQAFKEFIPHYIKNTNNYQGIHTTFRRNITLRKAFLTEIKNRFTLIV